MDNKIRNYLINCFRSHNQRLYKYLGVNFNWENEEFREKCKDHCFELREDVWSKYNIIDILSDIYKENKEQIEKDLDLWRYNEDPEKYVDILFEWILERLEFCDSYFNNY